MNERLASPEEEVSRLREELARYKAALEQFEASLILLDADGYVTQWSPTASELFGYSEDEALGQHILFLYSDEAESDAFLFNRFLDHDRQVTVKYRRQNGEDFWARMLIRADRNPRGETTGLSLFILDINRLTSQEERERLNARMLEHSRSPAVMLGPDLELLSANQAYYRLIRNAPDGETLPHFFDPAHTDADLVDKVRAHLGTEPCWTGEVMCRCGETPVPMHLSLSQVRNEFDELLGYFGVIANPKEMAPSSGQIQYDSLTRLPNRAMFITLVERALAQYKRKGFHGAVLCVKLDGLNLFNEHFGYLLTDQLVVEATRRLQSKLREADLLGRLDGSQFVISLFDLTTREHAAIVARHLAEAFHAPFELAGHQAELTLHIGISIFPEDGDSAALLIKNADIAQKRAQTEKEPWVFFTDQMQHRAEEQFRVDALIREGLGNKGFCLFYQPKIDSSNGRLVSAEALIRLRQPDGRILPPGVFMPYAEGTRHIHSIGDFVLREACRQQQEWGARGLPRVPVAVNVSAHQLRAGFPQHVAEILDEHGVAQTLIELELTESAIMSHPELGLQLLNELRERGFALAMDDFGTGYSNISMLRQLPIDTLKIDRAYIMNLPDGNEDRVIFQAIISMAKALGFSTVAEGVETEEQVTYLLEQGCETHQGYFYSKPIPAEEFETWLTTRTG